MSSGSSCPASMKVLVMRGGGHHSCRRPLPVGVIFMRPLMVDGSPQDTVFDQHGAPGNVPFVVHVEAAAAVLDGAVVDHGHPRSATLSPEDPSEHAPSG